MVVGEVLPQGLAERFFTGNDDVIEALSASGADHALSISVLPGRARSAEDLANIEGLDLLAELFSKDAVAVALQVARSAVEGKGLHDLPGCPSRRRPIRHVEVNDAPTVVPDDDEDIENAEQRGWNGEEVHGGHLRHVVLQEGLPVLRGRLRMAQHVLGDGRLGHGDAELQQFAVNPGRAPEDIVLAHRADEVPRFLRDGWPTGPSVPNLPRPVPAESAAVPVDDGVRLEDRHRRSPSGPKAGKDDPESAVVGVSLGFGVLR